MDLVDLSVEVLLVFVVEDVPFLEDLADISSESFEVVSLALLFYVVNVELGPYFYGQVLPAIPNISVRSC